MQLGGKPITEFARTLDLRMPSFQRPNPASLRRWIVVISTILFLIVSIHAPIVVRTNLPQDDGLFMALGRYLAAGHWLGPYGQNTLAKGPGYPMFLALNAWLGLPVGFTQAAFQAGAIGLFFWVLKRLAGMPNMAAFGYVFTLWAPAPYLPHILREAIYPGEMLLVLGTLSYMLLGQMRSHSRLRWAVFSGLLAGWMALTREEGIWIVPGIAMLVVFGAWLAWRKRNLIGDALAPLLVMFLAFMSVRAGFEALNWVAYGKVTGVEMDSAPFKSALGALQSVDAGPHIPYLPVSRQTRMAIYAVSPSFRSLKDYFDPEDGQTPWQFGCSMFPDTCGDIAGGWFMWALRDAVSRKGYYASPKKAAAFYRELTQEVKAACRDHRLKCSPRLFALLPYISAEQWRKLPASLWKGIRLITDAKPVDIYPGNSAGSQENLKLYLAFLGNPTITPLQPNSTSNQHTYHIVGWYRSTDRTWISGQLDLGNGQKRNLPIHRVPSPDLVSGFKDPLASRDRFNFTVTCHAPCHFQFIGEHGNILPIDLSRRAGRPFHVAFGKATLNIDRLSRISSHDPSSLIQSRASRAVRNLFLDIYSLVLPWLAAASLIAMLIVVGLSVIWRRLDTMSVLAATTWALIATRLVLLGVIDISSFHGMQPRLLAPAYILVCLAVVLTFSALLTCTNGWRASVHSRTSAGIN